MEFSVVCTTGSMLSMDQLPFEILVIILTMVSGMEGVVKLVCKNFYEVSSMVKGKKIPCGEYAAQIGSFGLVKWLLTQGCRDDFCVGATRGGHLNLLQFLMGEMKLPFTHAVYKTAVKYSKIDILDWLVANKYFDEKILTRREFSCKIRDLETLKWIIRHFKSEIERKKSDYIENMVTTNPFCDKIDQSKRIETNRLDILRENIILGKFREALSEGAIIGGNPKVVEYLRENDLYSLSVCLETAIKHNKFAFFEQYCKRKDLVIDDKYIYLAAEYGNLEAFQKMIGASNIEFYSPKIYEMWCKVLQNGHCHFFGVLEEIFESLQDLKEILFPPNSIDCHIWKRAIWSKNASVLDWLFVNMKDDIFHRSLQQHFVDNSVSLEWIIKKAIDNNNISYLRKLLELRYLDVSKMEKDRKIGVSVTEYALSKNNFKILKILTEKEFPLDPKIIYQFAIENNNYKLLVWVLVYYDDVFENGELELCALTGDLKGVMKRLRKGDPFEEKIVGWAAKAGHREVVQWLTINVLIPKYRN